MKSITIKRTDNKGDEQEYKLAFTPNVVRNMDRKGFTLMSVVEHPMDGIPELFAGAFRAFCPTVDRNTANEIWEDMPDKENLVKLLMEMYKEPIEAILGEPKEKNASWEVVE